MTNSKDVLQGELQSTFRIDNEGSLERLFRGSYWRTVKNVDNCNGYCLIGFNDRLYYYHRIVWILINGDILDSNLEIDHIDNNKLNNKIENLRLVSNRKNQQNTKKQKIQQKIGYYFHKKTNKWRANIQINKKSIHLGLFDDEKEVSQMYQIACENTDKYENPKQFKNLCKSKLEILPN
jgi:hypothetical protein